MMAQDRIESTRELINYGRFINQFPSDIIKSIQQLERIDKKYVDKNVLTKKCCPNTHTHIYVVTKQKVTEWEITKIAVVNEMEIFITLTK